MSKKIILLTLIPVLFFLGCSKTKESGDSPKPTSTQSTSYKAPKTKTNLSITNNSSFSSKIVTSGSLTFFADKENNNRLSVAEISNNSTYILQNQIKDYFKFSIDSIINVDNTFYFSSISNEKGIYKLKYDNKEIEKLNSSYALNLIYSNNKLYYVDLSKSNKLYSYNIKNKETNLISEEKCGKFIINGDFIIYQNLSDNSKLYCVKNDGTQNIKLTDSSADSFVPYNNELLYINLSDNNTLHSINVSKMESKKIADINGENLKLYKDKLFFIDKNKANTLSGLTIGPKENEFSVTPMLSESINDYYPTESILFLEKSIDINKTYLYEK